MAKEPRSHKDTTQHGWAPDVDATHTQDNPSARRSFHPDENAPRKGSGRQTSPEETGDPHGRSVKSSSRRGETQAKDGGGDEGMHDTGPKGRSRRPSGTRDATAVTGVDAQDPSHGGEAH